MSRPAVTSDTLSVAGPPARPRGDVPGLDELRILALLLVITQHGLSVLGREEVTNLGPINLGAAGVSIFLAISGYLAALSEQPPVDWLKRRLSRVYPAYWLAMLVSFGVTAVFGYKTFGPGQFVSQMLGVGLYTHPGNLVNLASWFISLLLLCYGIVFVARVARAQSAICCVVVLVALWQGRLAEQYTLLPAHVVSFLGAYLIARLGRPVWLPWSAAGVLGLAANPLLVYPALSLGLLGFAGWSTRARPVAVIVEYSYEFYLIHGMFFVGAGKFLRPLGPAVAIGCAVAASFVAAVVLNRTVRVMRRWTCGRPTRSPEAPGPIRTNWAGGEGTTPPKFDDGGKEGLFATAGSRGPDRQRVDR